MRCNKELVEALVLGGAVLGGGGGGYIEEGLKLGHLALEMGEPEILPLNAIDPEETVITVAAVGAPAAENRYLKPMDYVNAVKIVMEALRISKCGLITNEMGGMASVNGLLQGAVLGLPVVDAPCNGRAHPTSLMGAMGLHKLPDYVAIQSAFGGHLTRGTRVELLVRGDIRRCSALVREASVQAGGIVAVARNPVQARYLSEHAAVGAMQQAISLGEVISQVERQGKSVEEEVARYLGGEVVAEGRVTHVQLTTEGGFDRGTVWIEGMYELVFWNEYMLLEAQGERLYTFPDLITTFDMSTHRPVTSAEIRKGMKVAIVVTRKEQLILGQGMREPELFRVVENAISRPIVRYVFGGE